MSYFLIYRVCIYTHLYMHMFILFFDKLMHYSLGKKKGQRKVNSEMSDQRKIALHMAFYFIHIFIPVLLRIVNIGACDLCSAWAEVGLTEAPTPRPLLRSDRQQLTTLGLPCCHRE